jgi:hypothetical protein
MFDLRNTAGSGGTGMHLATDITGRCFVSYRRSHVEDVSKVVAAMLDHGVPAWQDLRDLASEPLEPALDEALRSPSTSGSLVWLSEDFQDSAVVTRIEVPRLLERLERDDLFFAEIWLADNLDFPRASELFRPLGRHTALSESWNVKRAETSDRILPDGSLGRGIDEAEARRVAVTLLRRRLSKIHAALPPGEPIRMLIRAYGEDGEAYEPGYAIQLNWSRLFTHRFAPADKWQEVIIPALAGVLQAVRNAAPGRALAVEGKATLAACLSLGRTFREVTKVQLSWKQHPSGAVWSLAVPPVDAGFRVSLRSQHVGSNDMAVLISVAGDVEPAVVATSTVPRFRAVLSVAPADGSARHELAPGQATQLARQIVGAIREARRQLRTIERIHLFLAGPAGLAVLLGQLLNAVGPVQTYEHDQTSGVGCYRAAALLGDPGTT